MSYYYVGIKDASDDAIFLTTPFSQQPPSSTARGIFDMCVARGFVKLDVYIDEDEFSRGAEVKLYKNGTWISAQTQSKAAQLANPVGKWVAFIEVTLTPGDPPIAVG